METEIKLPPEEYRRILQMLELQSITLQSCSATSSREIPPADVQIETTHSAVYAVLPDRKIEVMHIYVLNAIAEPQKETVVSITATFAVILTNGENFTADFFDIYKDQSLVVLTFPYFRELAANLTSRMNIPPIILPFIKRG